jgi:hypothetical protein
MKNIIIDPVSKHYLNNKLFDECDMFLNRDRTLEPGVILRRHVNLNGGEMHTVDVAVMRKIRGNYWNMGNLDSPYLDSSYDRYFCRRELILFEPPVVKPQVYSALNKFADIFSKIYAHSPEIIARYLEKRHHWKVKKFYWPMPPFQADTPYFDAPKDKLLCCIIGVHHPRDNYNELYSLRVEWISELSKSRSFDLYGKGWYWPGIRTAIWPKYFFKRTRLLQRYQGIADSKIQTMCSYNFTLCIENMRCEGYVTEKIFDCFFAGSIPIYFGAPDITSIVPSDCFISLEEFSNAMDLLNFLENMPDSKIKRYRKNIRAFLSSHNFSKFEHGLRNAILG